MPASWTLPSAGQPEIPGEGAANRGKTAGFRRRDGRQHGDDADPRLARRVAAKLGALLVGFDYRDRCPVPLECCWFSPATDTQAFQTYVDQVLVPELRPTFGLRQPQAPPLSARGGVHLACGATVLPLPPYSSTTPYRELWSKFKTASPIAAQTLYKL